MEIIVEERKFSVTSKYDISAPDCKYHAVEATGRSAVRRPRADVGDD